MSAQAQAGMRAWRKRAPGYAAELQGAIELRAGRAMIEADARRRFDRWDARGRLPLWLRVKLRLRALLCRFGNRKAS
jgi:hypothetical protein